MPYAEISLMKTFDLIIIGGGAGAFGAAIRANELHAQTALINAGLPLGGTCVNVVCVPSKALLYAGEVLHLARHHGIPGIELEVRQFDFQRVVQDELALVETLRDEKYSKVLKGLEYVTHIEGRAKFVSSQAVAVNGETIHGDKFIIATGSTAAVPPVEGTRRHRRGPSGPRICPDVRPFRHEGDGPRTSAVHFPGVGNGTGGPACGSSGRGRHIYQDGRPGQARHEGKRQKSPFVHHRWQRRASILQ